ncbi:MAG: DNA-binding protein WhiA [Ruminococcus sp.]|nr:DNA-binding protein WhiA [Ruminococcus sp.]
MEISFSYKVKEEIISKINSKPKADVCLMGMLTFCNSLSDKEIVFLTENKSVADFFQLNIKRICENENAVSVVEIPKKNDITLYNLSIASESDRLKLLEYFRMDSSRRLLPEDLPKEKFYPQLISGIFLACGSVNNPKKKYHLEFVMPTLELCNDVGQLIIEQFHILPKHTERKNSQIVYIKESENIIDLLMIMGATNSSFELMNMKIYKDMRNKINRAVNCDNANIEKSLKAAERQIEDIELIDKTIGLSSLPDNLQEIADLRYNNPDYNLKELGQALDPPISRSGANHRLAKLSEIAEDIRLKNQHL